MTRNLYLGSGLANVLTAPDTNALVTAVTKDWQNVVATDFPTRAHALADEIARNRPDLIGLQEVEVYREQTPADGSATPNATEVVYDFLARLEDALRARGLRYSTVAVSQNFDVEAPRANPASANGLTDVRLTDRDAILKNDDTAGLAVTGAPTTAQYRARVEASFPTPTGRVGVPLPRGYAYIDATLVDKPFRFVTTHLEPAVATVQVSQGNEALAGPLSSSQPVLLTCDCNSAADGSTTTTYANLIGAGFTDAWTATQGSGGGNTWTQSELLDNLKSQLSQRIDLVLFQGATVRASQSNVTGATPFRRSTPPFWASDHAGVVAQLVLK